MNGLAGAKREMEEDDVEDGSESQLSNGESPLTNDKSVTVDIDLLNCTICFLPLQPPLFQCRNSHVACTSCRKRLHDRCPTCRLKISYSRCIALEKLVESIKVACSNEGCNEKVSYAGLRTHEEDTCIHAPFFCPMQNCAFSAGSIELLSAHADNCHKDAVKHLKNHLIQYWRTSVSIEPDNPLYVIRLDNYDEVLFLLVNDVVSSGNALSMTCISPQTSEYSFEYELRFYNFGEGSSLSMKSSVKMGLKKLTRSSPPKPFFLLVPRKFNEVGSIKVYIDIKKKHVPSTATK